MKEKRHVIVIGGGASGMVAAISAARNGAIVTILEQKDMLGKKILSTGNGKCNYTNEMMDTSCFRSDDLSIIPFVLSKFGTMETLSFFEQLGVLPKNRQGYYYPRSEQATAILEVLKQELKRLSVTCRCNEKVTKIEKKGVFHVFTNQRDYTCDSVILSTGGKASPVLGSDGSGYALAKAFGHTIRPVVPALVQLRGKGTFFKMISGVRAEATVSLSVDHNIVASDRGEVQFTNYGISGIPVFQISRYAAVALYKKQTPIALIDFLPEYEEADLVSLLQKRLSFQKGNVAEQFLIGMVNQKLIPLLLRASKIPMDFPCEKLTKEMLCSLAAKCKHFSIEITETNPFEQAQICAGGVSTCEINPKTMESLLVKNLYITGELQDVDGICGGYNLQWAWATGYLAGAEAAKGC